MSSAMANKAHSLDGRIPPCFHIGHHWPAASDEQRWAELL
jgi:hypothetical protein